MDDLRFDHQTQLRGCHDYYTETRTVVKDSNDDRQHNESLNDRNIREPEINDSMKLWLKKVAQMHNDSSSERGLTTFKKSEPPLIAAPIKKTNRIIGYNDLPYMGEMTLTNSKPRRGRKPKKADICHLIYKNYGTVFSDQPGKTIEVYDVEHNLDRKNTRRKLNDITLEKRLPQQGSSNQIIDRCRSIREVHKKIQTKLEEPLNLCVRDSYDGNIQMLSNIESDECAKISSLLPPNGFSKNSVLTPNVTFDGTDNIVTNRSCSNACIHPKTTLLLEVADQCLLSGTSTSKIEESHKAKNRILMAKNPADVDKEIVLASAALTGNTAFIDAPHKRKRSAIFIPPVLEESTTNHATEVSICKFKFTGGATPSLQEKKILSVDAGGNFRYYSGTGDKSIRGYEFFPRESLQQSSLMACSSAGAFLNASRKRIQTKTQPWSHMTEDDLTNSSEKTIATPKIVPHTTKEPISADNKIYGKRKSRRSIQREKLEKTFKEKGFLIQTQQLQSAEGATYCKFRQLRKFTRYLFRSWKDYLPGELQQHSKLEPENSDLETINSETYNDRQSEGTVCVPLNSTKSSLD